MREIRSHTSLRGIAAFLVVLYHYKSSLPYGDVVDDFTGFIESAYHFVDFFFVLSGFVIAYVYLERLGHPGAIKNFFVSRVARIYPLHMLTLIVMACLSIYESPADQTVGFGGFFHNVVLVHAWGVQDSFGFNFPSWSISGEMAAYILFPMLSSIVFLRRRITYVTPIILVSFVILGRYLEFGPDVSWERLCLFRAVPCFFLGVWLFSFRDVVHYISGCILSFIQVAVAILIFSFMHFSLSLVFLLPLFCVLILTTYLDSGPIPHVLDAPCFYGLGSISFTVYMLHVPVRAVGYHVWPKFDHLVPESFGDSIFFILCIAFTLFFSAIVYRWFEIPMRQKLRNLFISSA